jgi:hypothetical protein
MPELSLSVSEEQLRRLEEVREDLEAAYVGPYGTVRREDALEYLLDTYTAPEESSASASVSSDVGADVDADGSTDTDAEASTSADPNAEADAEASDDATSGAGEDPGDDTDENPEDTLQQAMSLLDQHDDKWRESGGDEPYEVDLPDGSTEAVRTKDDIKRLLFKHWR